jgi:guanylate kinase
MDSTEVHDRLKQKLESYQAAPKTAELLKNTPILLLVGISGAGKDSIKHELLKTGDYHHIVSHTTRAPRENHGAMERDGIDYHFTSLAEAEKMLDNQAFVEAKMYSGNIYGTSVAEIQKAHDTHKIATTTMEVQGVAEYMTIDPDTKAVFILPPSYKVWQERFTGRYGGTFDQEDYTRRLHTAGMELQHVLHTHYFHFVVNDSLEAAVAAVNRIATGVVTNPEQQTEARHVAELLCQEFLAA